MAYIPDEKIDEIRTASDIADVVGEYVRLKRQGQNLFGLCPFHNEKSPSFSVNPEMGIFKCFGCGEGGDVFAFISKMEMVSFPEAARILAERAGIDIPESEAARERASETDAIYEALRTAARFYYFCLTRKERGAKALQYLKDRGFTADTIKQFGLGYAPDAWEALLSHAEEKHLSGEHLERAGLVLARKSGDGYYDRFRGRVMFPIFSHIGKVVGFGGRILDDEVDQPKYINSPETDVYHKSRVLYGLYQAKQAIRDAEEVVMVEGYTDVIALHQAGVQHVVASSGTSLTEGQVQVLDRYAQRILLLYDADSAGVTAMLRGINTIVEQGLAAYAVALPGDEDPDSYVQHQGAEAFRALLREKRQDFVAFMVAAAEAEGRMDTPEGAAQTMREVLGTIARMPDPLLQDRYLRRASDVLDVPEGRLERVLQEQRAEREEAEARKARRAPVPRMPPYDAPPPDDRDRGATAPDDETPTSASVTRAPRPQEEVLLALMLYHKTRLVEFVMGHMATDEFTEGPARTLVEKMLDMYEAEDTVRTEPFTSGAYGEPVRRLASEVLVDRYAPSANWKELKDITVPSKNEDPYRVAGDAMSRLKLLRVQDVMNDLSRRLQRHEEMDEDTEVRALQEKIARLTQVKRKIKNKDFIREELRA
ncbi:MAG: DNA primase [Bacteroidetes bacterium]|nr:DNA primase [Bacteroidota bacterium]